MVQQTQQEVQRFVGVASTVAGLVCYALSSSFNNLFGKWTLFKIFAYLVSSSIICLAVLFPKAWQHLRVLHRYRAHFAFLVLISTTVYSFYLDRKSKTKPDAYGLISSAAFATTSLCMSMQIECGFLDLMYFFCGLLVMQLMQIKPLLVFVGIGFGYFLVILRSYLDAPPNRSQSQPPQVVINMASLPQSSALDARPQEEEGGSNQTQAAIAPVNSSAARRSAVFGDRKTLPIWTEHVRVNPGMGVEGPPDDGYSWRKYGQKEILGAKYPRGYYRCTHGKVQGCLARKQVQRSDEDPTVFEITYRGRHTCTAASSSNAVPATSTKEHQDSNLNTNSQQQQNVLQSLDQQPINELLLNPREGLRVQTENLDAPDQPPFLGSLYFPSTSNIKTDNQVFPPPHPVLPENFTPASSPLPPQE